MRTNKKTLAAGIGSAGLLGLGLYLAVPAAAANPTPSPSASESPSSKPSGAPWRMHQRNGDAHPRRHGMGDFRGVHGEATVRREDGFHLSTWQRGAVTARSGATLTVRSEDGVSWTWTTDAKTVIRKEGDKSALSALANGDQVLVFGERSGNTRTAKLVRAPKKP
ncbi:DUF5666 domain-containing protein [Actinomadura litoris]|uniref:DUF5666 domain-containing protein n=1 Tax=Actinomadura litoris TaxID=2678616 RepID=A0A7K1L9D4_9ACTN|nr:DUF5666 domain-containing protein [Actinomadura litoris]MUN41032.1 hypothetical protein [Actinomadura litoris]